MLNTPFIRNASLLLARLPIGFMFASAGFQKIGGYAGVQKYMDAMGVPGALLPLVILAELGFGLMLIVGFQSRYAALALAGFTLLATFIFHFNLGDQTPALFFFKNLAITGGLMAIVGAGAGTWSVDEWKTKSDTRLAPGFGS
ncbi:DoxX family protein [Rhabdaerophilum sp.]|uniref:DoxX family protein n=1 Tax=Rhabdaerophilum sp. TaxID=2717341 RepID=UPI0038D3E939